MREGKRKKAPRVKRPDGLPTGAMDVYEANRLAVEKWGQDAFARNDLTRTLAGRYGCEVGSGLQDRRFGEGRTFEEAFENAAASEAEADREARIQHAQAHAIHGEPDPADESPLQMSVQCVVERHPDCRAIGACYCPCHDHSEGPTEFERQQDEKDLMAEGRGEDGLTHPSALDFDEGR